MGRRSTAAGRCGSPSSARSAGILSYSSSSQAKTDWSILIRSGGYTAPLRRAEDSVSGSGSQPSRPKPARLQAVQYAAGTVDVHAAGGDHAPGHAAEGRHQCRRLAAGAEDEVDHDLGRPRPQVLAVLREPPPVAQEGGDAGWQARAAR